MNPLQTDTITLENLLSYRDNLIGYMDSQFFPKATFLYDDLYHDEIDNKNLPLLNRSSFLQESLFVQDFLTPFFYMNKDSIFSKQNLDNAVSKKLQSLQPLLEYDEVFIFGKIENYVILEIFYEKIDSENIGTHALQYAICAFLMQYKSVAVILHQKAFLSNNSYTTWQNCYQEILSCFFTSQYHATIIQTTQKPTQDSQTISPTIAKQQTSESADNATKSYEMRLYAALYYTILSLSMRSANLEGKFCVLTGSNQTSLLLAKALNELHAKVLTLSDKYGFVYDRNGLHLELIEEIQNKKQDSGLQYQSWLEIYAKKRKCDFITQREKIWEIPSFAFFLNDSTLSFSYNHARNLLRNGCKCVSEYLPCCDFNITKLFLDSKICYIPFTLTQSVSFYPYHTQDSLQDFYHFSTQIYEKITQNATIAKKPTDSLLGILLECYKNMKLID